MISWHWAKVQDLGPDWHGSLFARMIYIPQISCTARFRGEYECVNFVTVSCLQTGIMGRSSFRISPAITNFIPQSHSGWLQAESGQSETKHHQEFPAKVTASHCVASSRNCALMIPWLWAKMRGLDQDWHGTHFLECYTFIKSCTELHQGRLVSATSADSSQNLLDCGNTLKLIWIQAQAAKTSKQISFKILTRTIEYFESNLTGIWQQGIDSDIFQLVSFKIFNRGLTFYWICHFWPSR
jgi:hypothetical protein